MGGAVLKLRNIAFGLLPVVVVVWVTVAVLGGAIHLAKSADPPDAGAAAKAGLGLCAISVAIFAGKAARRAAPPLLARLRRVPVIRRPQATRPHVAFLRPPATGPPILLLLQVSRT